MPFWHLEFIRIYFLEISVWSVFVSLAFALAAFWVFRRMTRKKFIKNELNFLLLVLGLFATIFLGARSLNWLESGWALDYFWNFKIGGFSFFGGLLFALGYAWFVSLYLKKRGGNFLALLNLVAAPTALALAIGRLGCLLANDHPGALTNLPWGIPWPNGEIRHPVALYLILSNLLLFLLLLIFERRKILTEKLGIIFLAWIGLSRFLLDFTRLRSAVFGDEVFFGLSLSQWIGLAIFALAFFSFCVVKTRTLQVIHKKKPA